MRSEQHKGKEGAFRLNQLQNEKPKNNFALTFEIFTLLRAEQSGLFAIKCSAQSNMAE